MACNFSTMRSEFENIEKDGIKSRVKEDSPLLVGGLLEDTAYNVSWELDSATVNNVAGELASGLAQKNRLNLSNIPAGYTYLGQLITHDIVPESDTQKKERPNFSPFLDLGSIYPDIDGDENKTEFTFGNVSADDTSIFNSIDSNGRFEFGAAIRHQDDNYRYILDRLVGRKEASELGDDLYRVGGVPQIPELRNDENAIISQLHLFFQRLHNQAVNILVENTPNKTQQYYYHKARAFVTLLFQQVVVYDYLKTILMPSVWGAYFASLPGRKYAFSKYIPKEQRRTSTGQVSNNPWRVPLEFSHAGLRFGHAMVLDNYNLTQSPQHKMKSILSLISGPLDKRKPIAKEHTVEWRNFFNVGSTPNNYMNRASKIDLSVVNLFNDGGIQKAKPESLGQFLYTLPDLNTEVYLNLSYFVNKSDTFLQGKTEIQNAAPQVNLTVIDKLVEEVNASDVFSNENSIPENVKNLIKLDLMSSSVVPTAKELLQVIESSKVDSSDSKIKPLMQELGVSSSKDLFESLDIHASGNDLGKALLDKDGKKLAIEQGPLWLYLLWEAQKLPLSASSNKSQDFLGPLGSWIIAEVLHVSINESPINIGMQEAKIDSLLGGLKETYKDLVTIRGNDTTLLMSDLIIFSEQ